MLTIVNIYSEKKGEINNFLSKYYKQNVNEQDTLKWEKFYSNPIEIADIIGTFIDNKEKFDANLWISLDKNIFINVTEHNVDAIIRYLFERFPY